MFCPHSFVLCFVSAALGCYRSCGKFKPWVTNAFEWSLLFLSSCVEVRFRGSIPLLRFIFCLDAGLLFSVAVVQVQLELLRSVWERLLAVKYFPSLLLSFCLIHTHADVLFRHFVPWFFRAGLYLWNGERLPLMWSTSLSLLRFPCMVIHFPVCHAIWSCMVLFWCRLLLWAEELEDLCEFLRICLVEVYSGWPNILWENG